MWHYDRRLPLLLQLSLSHSIEVPILGAPDRVREPTLLSLRHWSRQSVPDPKMALRQLAKTGLVGLAGMASGSALVAHAEKMDSKYFDPEALERGAKALREINASPHAKRVGLDGEGGFGQRWAAAAVARLTPSHPCPTAGF